MKRLLILSLVVLVVSLLDGAEPVPASVIQTTALDATRPYFIPTHPRVTTTVRFPKAIGAPDGAVGVFTEDGSKQSGDYLVTWQGGDAYFTLTPTREAQMANLNVPYEGRTYVLYFFVVPDPLKAVAAVNLTAEPIATAAAVEPAMAAAKSFSVVRAALPPTEAHIEATRARLMGLLDRLKLLHAAEGGPEVEKLAAAMNVQVAFAPGATEISATGRPKAGAVRSAFAECDAAVFQIQLLRAVRDPRLNCVGFICRVRNTSSEVLAFDVGSFGARAGAVHLPQRVCDAVPILKPGEAATAYFVVQPQENSPLRADNDWRISVDLLSPRLNPGAAIARGFKGSAGKS